MSPIHQPENRPPANQKNFNREVGHNPAAYPNPNTFDPTRYLGDAPAMDPRNYALGFGRRVWPGKEMADMSLWLSMAKSLAAFDIRKPRDEHDVEIEPAVEYCSGTIKWAYHSFFVVSGFLFPELRLR